MCLFVVEGRIDSVSVEECNVRDALELDVQNIFMAKGRSEDLEFICFEIIVKRSPSLHRSVIVA